jgi:alpha-tubulin suppressor-like RCC1 family protein
MILRGVIGALAAGGLLAACAQIAGLSDHQPYPVTQITAGADHACLLMIGGDVWCWGDNTYGQLGHRTQDGGACTTACPAAPVEGISGATQISAGVEFTCAVIAGGSVQCWGRNDTSQLGRTVSTTCGTMAPMVSCDDTPAAASAVSGAVQVTAGAGYACARLGSGGVVCWGDNSHGQLGTGSFTPAPAAVAVKSVEGAVDVSASLVGPTTCAAASAGVWCWGLNAQGGAGHPPGTENDQMSTDKLQCAPTPTSVPGTQGAVAVRAGDDGACAQLAAGGYTCWGYDGLGALGTKAPPDAGVPVTPGPLTVLASAQDLDLRADHACAVDGNGAAWCWGESGLGALGTENGTLGVPCDQGRLCQRKAQAVGLASVSRIAVGAALSVALLSDGTVQAWGMNDTGQLGHRPRSDGDGQCPADAGDLCNGTPNRVTGPPP